MNGWSVCLDYGESVPDDVAGRLLDHLTQHHGVAGSVPGTGGSLSLRMTVECYSAGAAVSLAEMYAADALRTVYGSALELVAVEAQTEAELERRLAE